MEQLERGKGFQSLLLPSLQYSITHLLWLLAVCVLILTWGRRVFTCLVTSDGKLWSLSIRPVCLHAGMYMS